MVSKTLIDHAVVQFVDQIMESFENNKYTFGVTIDLSKAFDNVDHCIPPKKLLRRWYDWHKSCMGQQLPLK